MVKYMDSENINNQSENKNTKYNKNYYLYSYSSSSHVDKNGRTKNKLHVYLDNNGQKDNYYKESVYNNDAEMEEIIKETGNINLKDFSPPKIEFPKIEFPTIKFPKIKVPITDHYLN